MHFDKRTFKQKLPDFLGSAVLNIGTPKGNLKMPHAQVLTIQNHYDDSSLKLERWIGEKKNYAKSILFVPPASQDF